MTAQQNGLGQHLPMRGWIHYAHAVIEVRRLVVVHELHGFHRRRRPASARPAKKECRPYRLVEQTSLHEVHRIPDTAVMKALHLRLDAVFASFTAISFEFFAAVYSIEFNRRIIRIRLETLIMSVEADRHH